MTVDGLPLDLLIDGAPAQNRAVCHDSDTLFVSYRQYLIVHQIYLLCVLSINFSFSFLLLLSDGRGRCSSHD